PPESNVPKPAPVPVGDSDVHRDCVEGAREELWSARANSKDGPWVSTGPTPLMSDIPRAPMLSIDLTAVKSRRRRLAIALAWIRIPFDLVVYGKAEVPDR
ncbi:hypothetical protein LCGC14_1797470, partial [marine sediment metagenome]